ncbi:MAG: DUF3793 family protein [Eubacteriales bacterium]|nr:DUF3793 family protein [Eubacteriales bacterium]
MSDETLILHCSPVLAGLKTANFFSERVSCRRKFLSELSHFNKILTKKMVRALPIKFCGDWALVYVYRPESLRKDLSDLRSQSLLKSLGYDLNAFSMQVSLPERKNPEIVLLRELSLRLKNSHEFPHEIGLFLGYPPEDVKGFIENGGQNCKCCGYWKVYGDAAQAEEKFRSYRSCTYTYLHLFHIGMPLEELLNSTVKSNGSLIAS